MKKWILLLSLLLAVQISWTMWQYERQPGDDQINKPLIDVNWGQIDRFVIKDEDNHQVTLQLQGGHWLVKEADNLPAYEVRIGTFIDRLKNLRTGWPVATTKEAHLRFRVSESDFVRRITAQHGKQNLFTLYLGSSPGIHQVHARKDSEKAIRSVRFNAFEASARDDDWIDRHLLKLDPGDIQTVQLPDLVLRSDGKGMSLANLRSNEQMNGDEVTSLVNYVSDIPISGLADDETGDKETLMTMTLTLKDGDEHHYTFSKLPSEASYSLSVSGRRHKFRVPAATLDHLKAFSHDKLVTIRGESSSPSATNQPQTETP